MVKQKQTAFWKAYQAHHDAFVRYCSALAYGLMDTEDLVQDTLLATYENFEGIRRKDQLLHYMIRTARNKAISKRRKSRFKVELAEKHAERLVANGVPAESLVDIQLMYQAMNKLSEKDRSMLIMFEISGFSIKEIAKINNCSEGSVKTRLSRARVKLRKLMQDEKEPTVAILPLLLNGYAMEKENGIDQLFDHLRQVPPEISEQQIQNFINGIPTLPPASSPGWLSKINGFSMNSILITTITTNIIFFSASEKNITQSVPQISALPISIEDIQEDTEEKEDKTSELAVLEPVKVIQPATEKPKTESFLFEEINDFPEPLETELPAVEDTWKEETFKTEQMEMISTSTAAKTDFSPQTLYAHEFYNKKKVDEAAFNASLKKYINKGRKNKKNKGDKDNTPIPLFEEDFIANCDAPVKVEGDVKGLRNRLLSQLRADQLIEENPEVVRISFEGKQLIVNRKLIPKNLQRKYSKMLSSYNIWPCDIRMVEITDDYIAIGDLTNEGFKGRVNGSINLDRINNTPKSLLRRASKGKVNSGVGQMKLIDSKLKEEKRPISDFNSIQISGLAVVYLEQGETDGIKIEASGIPIEQITTEVNLGILYVSTIGDHNGEKIKITVSTPSIREIKVGGAAELYIQDPINVQDLEVSVLDVGAAWINVNAQKILMKMQGGDLSISGTATSKESEWIGNDAHRGTLRDWDLRVKN
ncbi:MAG: sigma-70 family RNA polymerase sigma factor [Bacteroidota bacterium]